MSGLQRQIGLRTAVALNMLEMIGVGPFITLPLIISALGGPQAMLGWVLGAVLAVCDGLVWAELGASFPEAGGSYAYLREIYGRERWGRLLSFLYAWQFLISAPLVMASGATGMAQYATFLFPALRAGERAALLSPTRILAMGICAVVTALSHRSLRAADRLAKVLWLGVMLTVAMVVGAGLTHFNAALAFSFPPGAFHLTVRWLEGLGAATLIATYDYWGYYTICFLGAEVEKPERTIPRAVLLSIAGVASLYVLLNLSVLGVIPWREFMGSASATAASRLAVVGVLVARTWGVWAGRVAVALVIWTACGSLFSLLLGGARVPYAAARDGNFFRAFGVLHPRGGFPGRAVLLLGGLAAAFCLFDLRTMIQLLVVIRIVLQFGMQQMGLLLLRSRSERPAPRPFRMWLYPLPVLIAIAGFAFMLLSRPAAVRELGAAVLVGLSGALVYLVRARVQREWPFGGQRPI